MKRSISILFVFLFAAAGPAACGSSDSKMEGMADAVGTSESSGGVGTGGESPEAGQLTAGEWDDNENVSMWRDFLGLQNDSGVTHAEELASGYGLYPTERTHVRVERDGVPAADVPVRVLSEEGEVLGQSRSTIDGEAYVWTNLTTADGPRPAALEAGTETLMLDGGDDFGTYTIDLPSAPRAADNLDILFTIDVTGSMLDEQRYLQSELKDVISRVQSADASVKIRTSINFYCDPEDTFTVRSNPFQSDVDDALEVLQAGESCSGGDYPEAVDEALIDAVEDHEWSESATARLLFIVLDAPPHQTAEDLERLHRAQRTAAEKGIRIIPILASGGDKPTEFMLRTLAVSTAGTYVFITDDSGIGNEHLEPTVGDYDVELLNDLLVRVTSDYAIR